MLSVGREINISDKTVLCRQCDWEGSGAELSKCLLRIGLAPVFLYAYRCPDCGSFDLARKGKLLEFRRAGNKCSEIEETLLRKVDNRGH